MEEICAFFSQSVDTNMSQKKKVLMVCLGMFKNIHHFLAKGKANALLYNLIILNLRKQLPFPNSRSSISRSNKNNGPF